MNKIRKPITFLILIFALNACICEDLYNDFVSQPSVATQIAATATEAARLKAEAAKLSTPTPTSTPTATATATATATRTPTPQPATITVKVGEVAELKTFNVIVTKAEYVTPNPKGAYRVTVSLENKTSTDLTYSINNFSVTNSAGKNTVVVTKPDGNYWADDFLPNSSVPAGAKSTLHLLAQVLSGIEKDFVFIVSFGNYTAKILLGR